MEGKRIVLSIHGEQTDSEGQVSEISLVTEGLLAWEDRLARLTYQESEMTGIEGAQMTIELEDGAVRVMRMGDYSSNFFFRQGHKCLNLYKTPFGTIEMGAYPTDVRYGICEGGGEVHLCYDLDMQGKYLGKNRLTMEWTSESPTC